MMRWLMLTALVAVFVFGLALTPTARAQSATATLTANANLRAGPGASFAKVGSASAGSAVTLAGCTAAGDWCRLTDGVWVFAELLESGPVGLPELEDVTGVTPAPTRAAGGLLATATPNRAAAGATAVPTAAAPASSGPVATGNANLRAGPGTGFERVGSVNTVSIHTKRGWGRLAPLPSRHGGWWSPSYLQHITDSIQRRQV